MITTELMCLWKKSYCHPDMINLVPRDWKASSVQNPDKTILPIVAALSAVELIIEDGIISFLHQLIHI
jgi:hypothetical protein